MKRRKILLILPEILAVFILVLYVVTTNKKKPQENSATPMPTTNYKTITDITYCSPNGNPQKLDLYIPDNTQQLHPVVVHVHGGSWTSGKKSSTDMLPYIESLVKGGIAVASINYRFAPSATFPSQIQDTTCAIRFLRAKADDFKIDKTRVGIMGESAGGHLASLAGLASDIPDFKTNEYTEKSSSVSAVLDIFGPANLTSYASLSPFYANGINTMLGNSSKSYASPTTYIDAKDPPFLLIHGDQDAVVPLSQSIEFQQALQAKNVQSELVIVKNAGHGLTLETGDQIIPNLDALQQKVLDFFTRNLK